ncbi:MAG: DUF305 domain-containing protein [Alphaproteobacteria bacterium]|jgi:uncharacterized protein (DUF305 family)|nr:DUF305 domain-containing protein [Alphaproteobacteria bacterium]
MQTLKLLRGVVIAVAVVVGASSAFAQNLRNEHQDHVRNLSLAASAPGTQQRDVGKMDGMMREMMPMTHDMMGENMGGRVDRAAPAPSTRAFMEVKKRMYRDMTTAFSGDADVDLVRGMISYHHSAIDMARVVLAHGKNETARKWAGDIVREQEREIAEMREWLRLNAR